VWQQHVAGVAGLRQAVDPCDRELRPPGAVEHEIGHLVRHRLRAGGERKLAVDIVAERRRGAPGLGEPLGRDLRVKRRWLDRAIRLVFEARQKLAQDAEARRDDTRGVAGMYSLLQHLDGQSAGGHAAQRGGQPQLIVIAAARIEADDQ